MASRDPYDDRYRPREARAPDLPDRVQKQLDELEEMFGEEVEKEEGPLTPPPLLPAERGAPRGMLSRRHRLIPPPSRNGARRPRLRTKKKKNVFVVVIVLALAVGGTLSVVLSPLPGAGRIRIDGSDSEWRGVRAYTSDPLNAPEPVDIVSFSFLAERSRISFLVKVRGQALAGGPAEPDRGDAFHFFIDLDADRKSGYDVAGIGADLAVRVVGRSGKVSSSDLLKFSGGDQQNFSGFARSGGATAAASGSVLEAQAAVDPGALNGDAAFTVAANGHEDSADTLGYPVSEMRPTLFVQQEAPAGAAFAKRTGVPLANLTLSSTSPVTLSSIALKVTGQVSNLASDVGTGGMQNGHYVIRDIAVSAPTIVHVTGDLDTATDQAVAGVRVESPDDVSGSVIALLDAPARDSLKYVGSAPPQIAIDGAFGDWRLPRTDTRGDSGGVPRVDITAFGVDRNGDSLSIFARVDADLFVGADVPFQSPLVIFQPPKPGNGSGVPPGIPRASGEDILAAYVDVDNSTSTGYSVGPIGADGVIVVTGRGGVVIRSALFRVLPGGPAGPALQELPGAAVRSGADSFQLEASANLAPLAPGPAIKTIVVASVWDRKMADITDVAGDDDDVFVVSYPAPVGPSAPWGPSPGELSMAEAAPSAGDPPVRPLAVQGELFASKEDDSDLANTKNVSYGSVRRAQSFTATYDMVLTRTAVMIQDRGPTADTITVAVRPNTAGNVPSASSISSSFTITGIGGTLDTWYWVTTTWSTSIFVSQSTVVWISVSSNSVTEAEGIWWALDCYSAVSCTNDGIGSNYAAGNAASDSGLGWSAAADTDRWFRAYSSEPIPFEDNMESSARAGRWSQSGGVWARGVPSVVGPSADHTRGTGNTNLWGTVIGGDYPNSATATLTTNYVRIFTATEATLSFWNYYDTENLVDGGRVLYSTSTSNIPEFNVLTPVGGYPSTCSVFAGGGCFGGPSGGWSRAVFDLTGLGSHTYRFRFEFVSDSANVGPGWYVDDLKVGYPVELLEVHTAGAGTGDATGEYVRLYNYGPFTQDLLDWEVRSSTGTRLIPTATILGGGTYDFYTASPTDAFVDAGDWVMLRDDNAANFIDGNSLGTIAIRADYMQYGSSSGTTLALFGLIWTGSNPPAPASSSQWLARDVDGGFTGVDTGDGADWLMIPEAGPGATFLALAPLIGLPLALLGGNRIRHPRRHPDAASGKH